MSKNYKNYTTNTQPAKLCQKGEFEWGQRFPNVLLLGANIHQGG